MQAHNAKWPETVVAVVNGMVHLGTRSILVKVQDRMLPVQLS